MRKKYEKYVRKKIREKKHMKNIRKNMSWKKNNAKKVQGKNKS